jgi:hypothetical protein
VTRLLTPPWARALEALRGPAAKKHEVVPGRLEICLLDDRLELSLHDVEKKRGGYGVPLYSRSVIEWGRLSGVDRRIAELWSLAVPQNEDSLEDHDWRRDSPRDVLYGDLLLLLEGHPAVL